MDDRVDSEGGRADNLSVLEHTLDGLLEWISRFDNKASILLGLDTAMLGFMVASSPTLDEWTLSAAVSGVLAGAALSTAIVATLLANLPRTRAPAPSLLFFGTIAALDENDYIHQVTTQTPPQRQQDLARQCHRNAVILTTKFRSLQVAYWATLIALIPWAATILLFRILTPGT